MIMTKGSCLTVFYQGENDISILNPDPVATE